MNLSNSSSVYLISIPTLVFKCVDICFNTLCLSRLLDVTLLTIGVCLNQQTNTKPYFNSDNRLATWLRVDWTLNSPHLQLISSQPFGRLHTNWSNPEPCIIIWNSLSRFFAHRVLLWHKFGASNRSHVFEGQGRRWRSKSMRVTMYTHRKQWMSPQ